MRTSITLIHGSILSYCYLPPPHSRDFQIIHYFIVYSTSLGIKYWWAPWLLGCKKMLLLIYFGKTQISQCKSVAAPRGTTGTGRRLGGLGDRFPQFSTRYFFNLTKFDRDSRDSTCSIYGRLKVKYEEQIHCSDKHIRSMRKV